MRYWATFMPVIILGIDPGSNFLGFAVIKVEGSESRLLDIGTLRLKKLPSQQEKLKEIFLQVQDIIERHDPVELAIEAPIYGKNPQSMLKLGRAQGVAMAAAMTMGLAVTEYSPKTIKRAVTGSGNASKEQVGALLQRMLKFEIDKRHHDATDALATAVCHQIQLASPIRKLSGKGGWDQFLKDNAGRIIK